MQLNQNIIGHCFEMSQSKSLLYVFRIRSKVFVIKMSKHKNLSKQIRLAFVKQVFLRGISE